VLHGALKASGWWREWNGGICRAAENEVLCFSTGVGCIYRGHMFVPRSLAHQDRQPCHPLALHHGIQHQKSGYRARVQYQTQPTASSPRPQSRLRSLSPSRSLATRVSQTLAPDRILLGVATPQTPRKLPMRHSPSMPDAEFLSAFSPPGARSTNPSAAVAPNGNLPSTQARGVPPSTCR